MAVLRGLYDMIDTEKPLFKLTPDKYGFYTLNKWVHDERNVYAEVKETSKWATVHVRGIYNDSAPSSFTLEIDENNPFEVLEENIERWEDEETAVNVSVNQRRSGKDDPRVDAETLQECEEELRISMYGMQEGMLEDEGWKLVGKRVGFGHVEVKIQKVSDVDS